MLRRMLATRRSGIAMPLSLVFLVSTAAPGCNKIQELTGKKDETTTEDSKTADAKTADAKTEEKEAHRRSCRSPSSRC